MRKTQGTYGTFQILKSSDIKKGKGWLDMAKQYSAGGFVTIPILYRSSTINIF